MSYSTRFLRVFCHLFPRKFDIKRNLKVFSMIYKFEKPLNSIPKVNKCYTLQQLNRKVHLEGEGVEFEDIELIENEQFEFVKHVLFKDSTDKIINQLNDSASVEDVMTILNQNVKYFRPEHITQTVLVLRDLQRGFSCYNGFSKKSFKVFNKSLQNSEGFTTLKTLITNNIYRFNDNWLSYVFYYINKFGIQPADDLMQDIAVKLCNGLKKNFNLEICARLLKVLFNERSIRPYNLSLELLPKIISAIDSCDSIPEFQDLTICLNRLNQILTNEVIAKYGERVEYLLATQLKGTDCKMVLKIVMLLNYPQWRQETARLIAKCLLLIKDDLNLLSVTELVTLYEVFYKNQEPGEMLNNIQRCSAKFLQQHEEEECFSMDVSLKLFSAFIYFCSPTQRSKFQNDVKKYLYKCDDLESLLVLKKLLSYVKLSDVKIYHHYWSLALKHLESTNQLSDVISLCQYYVSFFSNASSFRHLQFEKKVSQYIEDALSNGELIFPSGIVAFLGFSLKYQAKDSVIEALITKFKINIKHMHAYHYLQLADMLGGVSGDAVPKNAVGEIRSILHAVRQNLMDRETENFLENIIIAKGMSIQNDTDNYAFETLLYRCKKMDHINSKVIETICGIFLTSGCVVPEILNKSTEYLVNYPENLIGFNAEKLLYLCYFLAYYPLNAGKFFSVVTDIIIRDQERLSSLAILQSALALSYFNKLPGSLIKQVFTIEFMDKLDLELANCYFKEKYPQRVRSVLMQLNRAVCLEYPEFNVPWFHKKYVEEHEKRSLQEPEHIPLRITEYLSQVVGKDNILENIITPYGYHLDFVISFDSNGNIVTPDSTTIKRRLALIVMKPHAYTRFYIHLKGKYQLKNKHLELLGYEVCPIKLNEWNNLLYAGERLEFLRKLIGQDTKKL